jgi:hypothetical protein
MAIIEEYDESLFISRFEDYKRVETEENLNGNFSYKGLRHLFNYLDDLSEDTGEDIKLDVIGLCCEYSEYKNLDEYLNDYSTELKKDDFEVEDDYLKAVEEEISEKTTLIKFEDDLNEGFIIQQF